MQRIFELWHESHANLNFLELYESKHAGEPAAGVVAVLFILIIDVWRETESHIESLTEKGIVQSNHNRPKRGRARVLVIYYILLELQLPHLR